MLCNFTLRYFIIIKLLIHYQVFYSVSISNYMLKTSHKGKCFLIIRVESDLAKHRINKLYTYSRFHHLIIH